ncbi:hypothetical protein ACFWP2_34820 [Kitasatospora sp. NPDC058444]|uniref:hypothetical protein n=1 Tax=Kitasatospora sp. NPDC058444 TaxID=3346504 RepID=UPI00365D8EFF
MGLVLSAAEPRRDRPGGALLVTGEARTDWSEEARQGVPVAERTVEPTVTGVVEPADATALGWTDPEYSPALPR